MKYSALLVFLIALLTLTACSSASSTEQTPPQTTSISTEPASSADDSTTRVDEQGAVTIAVTPLNLDPSANTLEFDVSLNTHSVDLSMDLATLSTLVSDTGITVQATLWDARRGGHHVSGKLIFPATKDGKSVLEGARKLTLVIIDIDTASGAYEWELP